MTSHSRALGVSRVLSRALSSSHTPPNSPVSSEHAPAAIPQRVKKYPELKNLPKAPSIRSLKYKNVLPGTVENIIFTPGSTFGTNRKHFLDPDHPALQLPPKEFPPFRSPLFTMRAYPFALLRPYSNTASYPFPSSNRHYSPRAVFKDKATQVPVGLVCIVGKKNVHNSAFIRSRIKSRMKEVLRLVVARGANVDDDGEVVMCDDEIGESRWLLREWVYIFQPTLEMYRHPLGGIIVAVRSALDLIKTRNTDKAMEWDISKEFTTYCMPNAKK